MNKLTPHPYKGQFIVLEGGEAVGKTSILEHLTQHYQAQGYDVIRTREPGGSDFAEKIRHLLFGANNPEYRPLIEAELLLMIAARIDHWHRVIMPALTQGKMVLCDRYILSTFVYQGFLGGIDKDMIYKIHEQFLPCALPQKMFLITSSAQHIQERLQKRTAENYYDSQDLDKILKLNQAYEDAFSNYQNDFNIQKITNDSSLQEALTSIIQAI